MYRKEWVMCQFPPNSGGNWHKSGENRSQECSIAHNSFGYRSTRAKKIFGSLVRKSIRVVLFAENDLLLRLPLKFLVQKSFKKKTTEIKAKPKEINSVFCTLWTSSFKGHLAPTYGFLGSRKTRRSW